MPTFANYLADDRPTSIGDLIALKPTSITIRRGSSTLSAQTVRLETLASQRMVVGEGGVTHQIDGVVVGVRNHPIQSDVDIQAGDRFADGDGLAYEVVALMPGHVDCVQAYVRIRS